MPPTRPDLVPRPRLVEKINGGLHRKLTLISGPAGFGKTTLVSNWVAGIERPVAWLSLDEGDNDPRRFLAYLVATLRTLALKSSASHRGTSEEEISPAIGEGVLGALQSSQPPTEAVLITLLNEITSSVPVKFVLILDDYHVIDAQPVDHVLTFLLENLPPQMHVVIATREDPSLPLARLRARGQMTELRAADLRFTPSEAAEFLNEIMKLNLPIEDISALENRTEGWIAGLQLAALALQGLSGQGQASMQGPADSAGFIQAFAGSHRFVLDYLLEEVLQRQPENIRRFLLQTAILDRLNASLCDAVTGQEGSRAVLAGFERGNLFVVPLDDQRQWYRYHRLFAEALRARASEEPANQVPALHQRASEWYERNNLPVDAIRHALAAGNFERAARLLELAYPAMDRSFQFASWLGWVEKLPADLVRARPVLSVDYAWALTDSGEFEASESWLRAAERRLEGAPESMVVADEARFRLLPGKIALARAYHAQAQGDIPNTVKYAELGLKLIPEDDVINRAGAAVQLGIAYWSRGDLEAAHRAMTDWVNQNQKVGNIIFVIPSAFFLAEISIAQGHLREAERIYTQTLQLASTHDGPVGHVISPLFLGLGLLHHETGNDEVAAQYLQEAEKLGEQTALVDWPYRWRLAQASLKESNGNPDTALDLLDEAQRLYVRIPVPDLRPIEALKARVWLKQGRLTEALAWVRERGLSVNDELSYLSEFEHVTLARVLLARHSSEREEASIRTAMELLERLRQAAAEAGRLHSVIEILVLQALAHQAQGNISSALASLEQAFILAEPEGFVRIFVDEGLPMAELLAEAAAHGIMPGYTARLMAALQAEMQGREEKSRLAAQPLIEPLSPRELEVLQLITLGLSNREIGERLFLTIDTVKGHNRRIYGKLQVQRRTEAVARARELGLV